LLLLINYTHHHILILLNTTPEHSFHSSIHITYTHVTLRHSSTFLQILYFATDWVIIIIFNFNLFRYLIIIKIESFDYTLSFSLIAISLENPTLSLWSCSCRGSSSFNFDFDSWWTFVTSISPLDSHNHVVFILEIQRSFFLGSTQVSILNCLHFPLNFPHCYIIIDKSFNNFCFAMLLFIIRFI
jgi:hypothetical protein